MRINQNIAAMNSYRNLSVTNDQMGKSLEKLSSGFRINRAAERRRLEWIVRLSGHRRPVECGRRRSRQRASS